MSSRLLASLLAASLLLYGCGGSGSGAVASSTTSTTSVATVDPTPSTTPHARAALTNPIVPPLAATGSADPSVVLHDGAYYYCRSLADGSIGIARAERLQDIGKAPMQVVWRPPSGTAWSQEVWAPELQHLQGRWYIYFAASDGNNANHRMYALQGDANDPQGGYRFLGKVAAPTDRWAIDGLAMEVGGSLYFVWSGWRDVASGFPQVLYIAPMSDPWTISGERREIAAPDRAWEQSGAPLLEGPAVLQRNGRVFITYSASGSWTDDYALGLLTYAGGDITAASSWVKGAAPVLQKRVDAGTFGPGHNSFVPSPDGREDWIVYHAIDRAGGGWTQRSVRAQPFDWSADGSPVFGRPVAPGVALAEPSR